MNKKFLQQMATGAVMATVSIGTLAACGSAASGSSGSGPIIIGGIAGTTGAYGATGISMFQGAQVAVAELNANGGILGRKVKFESFNDNASATLSAQEFQRLVSSGAVAVTGSSDDGPATAAEADRYKIPDVGIVDDGGPTVYPNGIGTSPLPWVYEFSPSNYAIGAKFAQYTLAHCKGLALLHDSTTYGVGASQALQAAYKAAGKSLTVDDTITENWATGATVGLTSEIDKIKSAGADCVDIWLTPQDQARYLQTAQSMGVKYTAVLGNDESYSTPTFTQLADFLANGVVTAEVTTQLKPNAALIKFTKEYQSKFGSPPGTYADATYDSIMMVAQAIKAAKSTSATAIQSALNRTSGFQGTTGTFGFTPQNHQTIGASQLTLVRYDTSTKTWVSMP